MYRLALLILIVVPALAQKKPITLDTLNQGSSGVERNGPPTWAPDGKSFVFRRGESLRIYHPAAKNSKELVSVEPMENAALKPPEASQQPFDWQNRHVHEARLQWSKSGKDLLYETGGDLFLIHADSGKWEQITETPVAERDPKLSPDGKTIAFRRGFDLYTIDIASHKETRLTTGGTDTLRNGAVDWVYPEELDLDTAFWWSPDSRSIAYLQFDTSREPVYPHEDLLHLRAIYEPQHYPQVGTDNADIHFGVVAAAGGPTRWIDVGDTRNAYLIARAGWMPDSKSVYVIRMNRIQNHLEMFSTVAGSGARSTVFEESDPYWINFGGDVQFLPDGKHFLWTSERDGFRHIYLYSNDGKDVKQITKGPWEVTDITGFNQSQVFYTSDEASELKTHLYSVNLDGSGKRLLDTAAGTHTISMGPGGSFYLDTYSSLTSPPRTTIHSSDGSELAVYNDADKRNLEEYDIRPSEIVSFKTPDGIELHGRLIKPAGFDPAKKYPVIVNVYGGPGVELPVHNSWSGINIDQVYAHKGYVVWQAENRGGSGRGHAFETPIFHHLGSIELKDQLAGVNYLISLGFVDPKRIGITGWSYGGFMTLNALLNAPATFKCGVAGAPVTNWLNYDTIYTERYMGLPSENAEGYRATALPPRAVNLEGKLMMIHNLEDDNVLFQNSMQMVVALERAGKHFNLMLYPQKTHGLSGDLSHQKDASVLEFFERNLK